MMISGVVYQYIMPTLIVYIYMYMYLRYLYTHFCSVKDDFFVLFASDSLEHFEKKYTHIKCSTQKLHKLTEQPFFPIFFFFRANTTKFP